MGVRYELYIRLREGQDPLDLAKVQEALGHAKFEPAEGMLGKRALEHGELTAVAFTGSSWDKVEVAEGEDTPTESLMGINFSFPLGLPDHEGERAIDRVMDVNDMLLTQMYDPQVGATVTRSDHDLISQAWRQSHEFHSGVAGTPGLGAGAPTFSVKTRPGIPTRYKIMAAIAGAILLVVLMVRQCFKKWLDTSMYPEPYQEAPQDPGAEKKPAAEKKPKP
jgi:hypothetical protein